MPTFAFCLLVTDQRGRQYTYKIIHTNFIHQVQDFYVALRYNDGDKTIDTLYRLVVVGIMLRHVKIPGKSKPHDYPKMLIAHLLILEYWKKTKHSSYRMMQNNVGIFNEEGEELSFAILGRCVLGDTRKDDFHHMNKIYSLLPLFRDLKSDIAEDNGSQAQLSRRHELNPQGEEVINSSMFFKSLIRHVLKGTWKSYDGTTASFKNSVSGSSHSAVASPNPVFIDKAAVRVHVEEALVRIGEDVKGRFLSNHADIWPSAVEDLEVEDGDQDFLVLDVEDDLNFKHNSEADEGVQDDCSEQRDGSEQAEEDEGEDVGAESDPAGPLSPYHRRGWDAWGTINEDNQMYGRRPRVQVEPYRPSKRRIQFI